MDAGRDAAVHHDAAVVMHDAAARDSGATLDADVLDADLTDAVVDAGGNDAAMSATPIPETLTDTGLFASGSSGALAPGVVAYEPRYVLWADDAEKQRWFYLPEGTQIDTSDMNHWKFPVGTKAWKLFTSNGKKLETRLLQKTADRGWLRMAFAWNDDESEAVAMLEGVSNVRGTTHDIPSRTDCNDCHSGEPDRLLGISAIQLSHDGPGMTLATLKADGKLSEPPAGEYPLPDTPEWNALGYLHANCGHCHNPLSERFDRVDIDLRLRVAQLATVSDTETYKTTVDKALTDTASTLTLRIAPGEPDMSGLIQRMELRGDDQAMPPIASEQVDTAGVSAVRTWIESL
jgi:hypothetical protein